MYRADLESKFEQDGLIELLIEVRHCEQTLVQRSSGSKLGDQIRLVPVECLGKKKKAKKK